MATSNGNGNKARWIHTAITVASLLVVGGIAWGALSARVDNLETHQQNRLQRDDDDHDTLMRIEEKVSRIEADIQELKEGMK